MAKDDDRDTQELADLREEVAELRKANAQAVRDLEAQKAEARKVEREARTHEAAARKAAEDADRLGAELKETRAEARDRRHEAKEIARERDDFAAQVSGLTTDRDSWKTKAETDPEGLRQQVADAQAAVRGIRHERAYEKVAKALRVNDPAKFADLLMVAKHTPDADEPDEAKISETFQSALKSRPWLVDAETPAPPPPAAPAPTPAPAAAAKNGKAPGSDRGTSLEDSPAARSTERARAGMF